MTRSSVDEVGIIRTYADDAPRIGSLGGKTFLWDEPGTSNLLLWSSAFDKTPWVTKGLVEIGNITTPQGDNQGARFIPLTGGDDYNRVRQDVVVSSTGSLTFSVFLKEEKSNTSVTLSLFNTTNSTTTPLVQTDYLITSGEKHGYGWYRHSVTIPGGVTAGNTIRVVIKPTNSTSVFYMWGAQLELVSHRTSYVPSEVVAGVRKADDLSIVGNRWGMFRAELKYFGGSTDVFESQIIENGYWFPKTHSFNKDRIESVVCKPIVLYGKPSDYLGGFREGVYFDPSDKRTLFKDHLGTIPVTSDGDSVGLIMDKSKDLVVGTVNKAKNGNFANTSDWTTSGTATVTTASNVLKITSSGNAGGVHQDIDRPKGMWSKISLRARKLSGSTGSGSITVTEKGGTSISLANIGITDTEWKTHMFYVREESDGIRIGASVTAGDIVIEIADVSVFDFEGNHAYQETETKKPKLQSSALTNKQTIYYLSFDGVDDFMETGIIGFGGDSITLSAGIEKENDTVNSTIFEASGDFATNSGVFNVTTTSNGFSVGSRGTSSSVTSKTGYGLATNYIVGAHADISSDYVRMRVNGQQVSEDTSDQGATSYGQYKWYLGSKGGTSSFFHGKLYSMVMVSSILDVEETADIERFTSAKCRGSITNS